MNFKGKFIIQSIVRIRSHLCISSHRWFIVSWILHRP